MTLCTRSFALAAGIIYGAAILLIGLGSMLMSGYGSPVLELIASIYPGYNNSGGFGDLIIGVLYAAVDGLLCGFIFAWLYNRFASAGKAN